MATAVVMDFPSMFAELHAMEFRKLLQTLSLFGPLIKKLQHFVHLVTSAEQVLFREQTDYMIVL
jgi:hypothetical protein